MAAGVTTAASITFAHHASHWRPPPCFSTTQLLHITTISGHTSMHVQKSLSRIREEQQRSGEKQGPDVSFELMVTAYRRKRLMEGLMSGDREAQNQILTMATSQLQADDGGSAERGRAAGERQRGAKAKSLQARLAEAGFGPAERAVVKRMATVLAPPGAADDIRDLEQLARFGGPLLRGLRRSNADMLVQTVRPSSYTWTCVWLYVDLCMAICGPHNKMLDHLARCGVTWAPSVV